jgi:hypothetical protein
MLLVSGMGHLPTADELAWVEVIISSMGFEDDRMMRRALSLIPGGVAQGVEGLRSDRLQTVTVKLLP